MPLDELLAQACIGTPDRIFQLEAVMRRGKSIDEVYAATKVDPWFLDQMCAITEERAHLSEVGFNDLTRLGWRRAKRLGFSDAQLAWLWHRTEAEVRTRRLELGVIPTYKTVDTCAAEFDAKTPYHYSTWEDTDEVSPSIARRSSSLVPVRIESAKELNSIIAAFTLLSLYVMLGLKPSW